MNPRLGAFLLVCGLVQALAPTLAHSQEPDNGPAKGPAPAESRIVEKETPSTEPVKGLEKKAEDRSIGEIIVDAAKRGEKTVEGGYLHISDRGDGYLARLKAVLGEGNGQREGIVASGSFGQILTNGNENILYDIGVGFNVPRDKFTVVLGGKLEDNGEHTLIYLEGGLRFLDDDGNQIGLSLTPGLFSPETARVTGLNPAASLYATLRPIELISVAGSARGGALIGTSGADYRQKETEWLETKGTGYTIDLEGRLNLHLKTDSLAFVTIGYEKVSIPLESHTEPFPSGPFVVPVITDRTVGVDGIKLNIGAQWAF